MTDPIGPTTSPSGTTPPETTPPATGVVPALLWNIVAGTRLALMLPVRRNSFRTSIHQAVLVILAAILVQATVQYFEVPPRRQFSIFGLTREVAIYGVMLLAAYCAVGVQRATASLSAFLVLTVSTFPLVTLAWAIIRFAVPAELWYAGGTYELAMVVAILWPLAVAYRAVRLIHRAEPAKAMVVAGIYGALFIGPAFLVPQIPIWSSLGPPQTAEETETPTYQPVDVGGTYYRQARLLDEAYKSLRRHRPGIPDLYFVGFGGYARQDVFLREVRQVRALFDQRFDTTGRSAILVNNYATIEDTPLANGNNLQRLLGEVAARMDVEEDILFLFLTSHGSRDHRLSAQFWPLQHNDLGSEDLADYLDQSGIKWRVIVVSACYAGGFIDSLADENSLIITAARHDRRSFGCSHEAEWTYFGRAFFDEQLRAEYSFTEAFDAAVAVIAEREQAEELPPSEPQIHIGSAIGERLDALRSRIEADGEAAPTN